jgi:hypothetical protein
MFQMGGEHWDKWNKNLKTVAIDNQIKVGCAAGSWDPKDPWGDEGGRVYSTALMILCLEVPYRHPRVKAAQVRTRAEEVEPRIPSAPRPGTPLSVRTSVLAPRGFQLIAGRRVIEYPLAVPRLVSETGTLEIKLHDMGDNSGDGRMRFELRNADGVPVLSQRSGAKHPTFTYEVRGATKWTLVLQDHDTRGDGNKGSVEVWVTPKT